MHLPPILFEELLGLNGSLGLITLNRPQALNALNHEMIISLHQQLISWESDERIKIIIIRAAPGRAFCAGGDIRSVYERHQKNAPPNIDFFCDEYRLNHYIFHYPKPYIALLDGITMGGGVGISLHGRYRIGTENLLFAMPETAIGFFPDVGSSYFLSRLPYHLGFYLGLTGARLKSDECLDLKLIDYKILSNRIEPLIEALTKIDLAENLSSVLDYLFKSYQSPINTFDLKQLYPSIDQHFAKDSIEKIITSLQKTGDRWCIETIKELNSKSPTSLKVTLRLLKDAFEHNFDQCLQTEYRLMCHLTQGPDFYEGIRALLIDKDYQPKWQPIDINNISEETIQNYFDPLPGQKAQLLLR
ncbi:MAG TPA: enoyl-CoA hydratase/isomerase family protein [Gammaproteobacteria bacterium]|nr:enoyl-CoA hydratase/isomerase family protein [Gammaproteobacteria bacterium]